MLQEIWLFSPGNSFRPKSLQSPNPYLVFRSVIKEGMTRGEIPKEDPDVAASMVMGVILQVIDTAILARRIRPPIKKLSGTIIAACLRVLNI